MKIYWRSKEGSAAPKNAQFYLRTFSNSALIPINEVISELPQQSERLAVLSRTDLPDINRWIKLIDQTLLEIESGRLEKVVIARETTLSLPHAPNPFEIAAKLSAHAVGTAIFCIDFGNGKSIVGATPERLYQRDQFSIQAEALAGTRKRAATVSEDKCFGDELLNSEKERREFEIVKTYLTYFLAPFCNNAPQLGDTRIHRTSTVQHLHAVATGTLQLIDDGKMLNSFHPSPALSGWPKEEALEWIKQNEPFERGYYCGAVGWQTDVASDWAALIRCCYIDGTIAKLYAGTGIVKGSDANKEWDELESKLSVFKEVFSCLS